MLYPEIEKYLTHLPSCEIKSAGFLKSDEKRVCTCGLEEVGRKLKWTHGMPCSEEGCSSGKTAAECGKCSEHCDCKYPYDDDE